MFKSFTSQFKRRDSNKVLRSSDCSIKSKLKFSFYELKNIRSIVFTSVLIALSLSFRTLTIPIAPFIHIGFSFLCIASIGTLYGPIMGGAGGMISDVIGHFLRPTGPFFIGFTMSAILAGFTYGIFMYKEKISPRRVFFCYLTINIFINVILNTLWLKILYNKAILVLFPTRLAKTAICFFPNYILLLVILSIVVRVVNMPVTNGLDLPKQKM